MAFAPSIPLGGLAGFQFLQRTYDRQFELFNRSPDIQRDIDHFLENAGNVISAEDLVTDRQMLRVVLGAFGLDEDINKQAYIRKVIEDGTTKSDAFANRLVERAYRQMSEAVGIGNFGSRLTQESVRQDIVEKFRTRQFEVAAGEVDFDMRLALNFQRTAQEVAKEDGTDRTKWLRLLGSQPLREVLQLALNLPTQFAQIDLDRQIEEIGDRMLTQFGSRSPSALSDPEVVNKMVDRFLLRSELQGGLTGSTSSNSIALSLLQSSGFGSGAQSNLFRSFF